jgi:aspartate/methionine/tyrosine aminotransferase
MTIPVNRTLSQTQPHASKRISDRIRSNPNAIDLTVGVPDFGPPQFFRERLAELVLQGSRELDAYNDSRGLLELRNAIRNRYGQKYGIELNSREDILVTHGAAEAIWMAVFALTNPGDEVMIPDPGYMLYSPIVKSLGRHAIAYPCRPENNFDPLPDDIAERISERTRLLIINSPSNPTGNVYDKQLLESISAIACSADSYVIHDEVFDETIFSGHHHSLVSSTKWNSGNLLIVNSLSKRFGMTGWRVGWMLGKKNVIDIVAKAHTYALLSCATSIQKACVLLFEQARVQSEIDTNTRSLAKRIVGIQERASSLGFDFDVHKGGCGGFYLFPSVSRLATRLGYRESDVVSCGEYVAEYLLTKLDIGVVAGSAFGELGVNHIRVSVAGPESLLHKALDRLEQHLQ